MEEYNNNSQNNNSNLKENDLNKKTDHQATKKQSSNGSIIKKVASFATIIVVAVILFNLFFNNKLSSQTVVTSMLQDQKVISQLSTLIVPYGGIYEERDDKGKEILDIAYRGTVEYGVDFSQINVSADDVNKKIIVRIPPIEIKEVYIDPSSISIIPEGKFNKTTSYLQKCKDDLLNRFVTSSDEMYALAKTTATETLFSFLNPIMNNIGDGYTLIVE